MGAINDVEMFGHKTDGLRTIGIRNKTKDRTIRASVHIGGACQERMHTATLKPLEEATIVREKDGDVLCTYSLEAADYIGLASPPN